MEEIWKPVIGYEGRYEVSNQGRVRTLINSSMKKAGGILSTHICKQGYHKIGLMRDSVNKTHLVHRLMAKAFLGDSDKQVNHKNGMRHDNRLENIEYVVHRENTNHMYQSKGIGRKAVGTKKVYQRWASSISINGKNTHLGTFDTQEEAHQAYVQAAKNMGSGLYLNEHKGGA